MCKPNKNSGLKRIDPCLRKLIIFLNAIDVHTLACCCGHGKYPMTIIGRDPFSNKSYEILSRVDIPRKKKFYKKDKQGFYYIPEVTK